MKISILIPIYNTSKYLRECLDSVLAGKNNYEIICINDGSTDECLQIIKEYMRENDNVFLINKENSGYGDSLNKGIAYATGDYIGILESDDSVIEGAFDHMLEIAKKTNADIIKGNYVNFHSEEDTKEFFENLNGIGYDEMLDSAGVEKLLLRGPAIWSAIYRRDFLVTNKLSFLCTPGAAYQDTSFAFKTVVMAKNIILTKEPIIMYRIDSGNSSSNSKDKVYDICKEYQEVQSFLYRNNLEKYMPLLVCAKHRSYMWNVGRLAPNEKKLFLIHIREEYFEHFMRGDFVRKNWDEYDWYIIHQIVFNIKIAFRQLWIGDGKLLEEKEMQDMLEGNADNDIE